MEHCKLKQTKLPLLLQTWFFSSLDMPDTPFPEALEACSLQPTKKFNISRFHQNKTCLQHLNG